MKHFVIDTNYVHLDYFLKGTFVTVLCQSSEVLRHKVYMPMVVFDEMVNQYREEVKYQIQKTHEIEKDVGRLTEKRVEISQLGLVDCIEKYPTILEKVCEEQGIELLPYPQVTHRNVVQRELMKKKPFREFEHGMTGYRDTLIWETIMELCGQIGGADEIVFLTNNTQDFCGKGGLHKHLLEDCFTRGLGEVKVHLVSAFHRFINNEILPASHKIENTILNAWKAGEIDLFEETNEHVNENELSRLFEYDYEGGGCRFTPAFYETTEVSGINKPGDYCIYDFRKLPKGDLLVMIRVDVSVSVDCLIYKGDIPLIGENEMPYISDWDWNDHYVAASDEAELTVQYDILIDSELKNVINVSQRIIRSKFETGFECEEKG